MSDLAQAMVSTSGATKKVSEYEELRAMLNVTLDDLDSSISRLQGALNPVTSEVDASINKEINLASPGATSEVSRFILEITLRVHDYSRRVNALRNTLTI